MSFKFFIFFFIGILLLKLAFGQSDFIARRLNMGAFTTSPVRHIISDRAGFIYFSTGLGVWRFDGTGVKPFELYDARLPQNIVPDLMFSNGRSLFLSVGLDKSTLFCYDTEKGRLHKYIFDDGIGGHALERDGHLLIVTKNGEVWRYDNDSLLNKVYDLEHFKGWNKGTRIQDFLIDQQGNMFVFTQNSVAKIGTQLFWSSTDSCKVFGDPNSSFSYVRRVVATSRYFAVNYSTGFVVYDKLNLKKLYAYHGDDFAFSLADKDSLLIFIKGIDTNRIAAAPYFSINKIRGIPTKIKELLPWYNHSYLVATDNGVYHVENLESSNNGIESWERKAIDFFRNKSVRSICRVEDKLYVGTYEGFFVFDSSGGHRLMNLVVYTMKRVGTDKLFLGIEGKTGLVELHIYNDSIGESLYQANIYITKIIAPADGLVISDHNELVSLYKNPDGKTIHQSIIFDRRIGKIRDVLQSNRLWWIASENGLFKWDGSNLLKIYPRDGSTTVYSMLETSTGLLLGTAKEGIVQIDVHGKVLLHIGYLDGLAGQQVYSLTRIDNLLYAGTEKGLSVFDFSSGLLPIPFLDNGSSDSSYLQELNHSATFWDEKGHRLIMGGVDGLVFINPSYFEKLKYARGFPLLLSYVTTGTTGAQAEKTDLFAYANPQIIISPDEKHLGIKFSNTVGTSDILFRIKEVDSNWMKKSLDDEVNLYALPHGTYTLQVRYPWQSDARDWQVKTLIVQPYFYQTYFFKAIIGLLVLGLVYLFWRSKLEKVRRDQQLRTTIASDLHDEVGSSLTRISMSSEMLIMNKQLHGSTAEQISRESKKAISSISDIIWSIDARNDTIDELIIRMREYIQTMFREYENVQFEVRGMQGINNVPQIVRQNTYLIFKEAVNNVLRHNGYIATWISLDNGTTGFRMEIKNEVKMIKEPAHTGQGLKNMHMRAERIKGRVVVIEDGVYFTVLLHTRKWV